MGVELSLAGKTALITGASRKIGIGAAIVRLLAQAGAGIFFTYYRPYDREQPWGSRPHEPEDLLAEIRASGARAAAVEADLTDPAVPARLFDRAEQEVGPVDILVNNAAYDVEVDLLGLTPELLDRHYAVNVRGAALLCAEFARRYQKSGRGGRSQHPGGRIINLVSGELFGPMPGNLPYVVTKGAVDALTISLSAELGPLGITVNAIDPGPTDTGWMPPELYQTMVENSYFGRVGQPEDVAHLVLFLASPLGEWITGQLLHSRGGL